MLEESKMDKKSINRSSQLQSRASAVDGKKSTELTHKPWLRNNKKREGPGSAPKNEPNRKNVPVQRGRGQIDRRPRARGSPNYAMGGAEIARLGEDEDPEIGSVYAPGSKKQNWNHLLNFMYTPRGGTDRRDPAPRRPGVQRTAHPRHSHDLYLRAYCQFVVKEDGDYRANILDPDVPIKWEQIEEIVVRSTGSTECPICLGAPVAGRTGLCGHVYCWPCVMHYAETHEKQPPPCPVCHAPLQVKDMKPTRVVQWESPAEEISMRLVRRLRGSTVVEVAPPRGQARDTAEAVLPLDCINDAPYAKFFAANKQQVHDIVKRERKEIENQILAEIDTTEIVFMEQALEMLRVKEESINLQCDVTKIKEEVLDEAPTVYEKQEVNQNRVDWFDVNEEGAACIDIVQEQMQNLEVTDNGSGLNPEAPEFNIDNVNENQPEEFPLIDEADTEESKDNCLTDADKQNQAKYFYFYQAADGQQVFLNSLNVRMLNASWGALAAAPITIVGRVLHRETLSLVEQTRKHMPYAAHLPLNCSFDIVEIDLNPPYVTEAAIKNFSEELDRRARQRSRLARSERRRERAWRRAAEGPPRPDVWSELQFPPPLSSPPAADPILVPPDPAPSPTDAPSSSGLSFAKMAGTSGTWRVRRVSTPPPAPAPEEEGSAPRALVLSDAIEAALMSNVSAPFSGKKNKKSKHKVLFATGIHRAA
ncbi:RING finger protein 10 [Leguminivora glycinivorella]|uniref:RING finger protein 10 n=1 Tax=Leguminivora glycinivorella TaxID=1035111 RepID=UPI00200F6B1A|nr:RING finger protein 10 [Leguminivora glycinivorella]